jgi:quercetin dioxygenase-like cupin family protein
MIFAIPALILLPPARVQDPVTTEPKAYTVILDSDLVRVVDVQLKAGGQSAMHSHPGYLAYFLTDGKVRLAGSDRKSTEFDVKAGIAMWRDAESHSVDNIGGKDLHMVHFELKESKTEIKPREGEDPVKVCPEAYKVLLETDRIRVCEVHAKAGSKSPMHGHPESVIYFLSDAKVKHVLPDKTVVEYEQRKGTVMESPALQHSAEVLGDKEAALIVLELNPTKKK